MTAQAVASARRGSSGADTVRETTARPYDLVPAVSARRAALPYTRQATGCSREAAVSAMPASPAAKDAEQARTVGLLLLGKGAVSAHGFVRPLAVEMDETEQ